MEPHSQPRFPFPFIHIQRMSTSICLSCLTPQCHVKCPTVSQKEHSSLKYHSSFHSATKSSTFSPKSLIHSVHTWMYIYITVHKTQHPDLKTHDLNSNSLVACTTLHSMKMQDESMKGFSKACPYNSDSSSDDVVFTVNKSKHNTASPTVH